MPSDNQAEADYWSSAVGRKWIEHQHALDTTMAGLLDLLIEAAALTPGDRVLDVGCGTGASTLAAARRAASVTGLDIAAPMLEHARRRAEAEAIGNVSFLLADAQTHPLPTGAFDRLISRFGVMFFADPVAAFANLRRTLSDTGRMAFIAWASVEQNPWFSIPRDIAVAHLGAMPDADPNAPGPFAFRDIDRVTGLLRAAGLADIEAGAVQLDLTPPGDEAQTARFACRLGTASRIIRHHDAGPDQVEAIEADIETRLADFRRGDAIVVPAIVNLFTCTAGAR